MPGLAARLVRGTHGSLSGCPLGGTTSRELTLVARAEMIVRMAQSAHPFPPMLEQGRSAYTDFYEWITSPTLVEALDTGNREVVESLPPPHRAIPLRILTSVGQQARTSSLEFHYTLPDSHPALRDWYASYAERLQQLVPEAAGPSGLWRGWRPPPTPRIPDSVLVEWSEIRAVAAGFAATRPAGLISLAFVFVRDWAFRLMVLYPELDVDLVLDDLLGRLDKGDDPLLAAELAAVEERERDVRVRSQGQVSTVWSIAIALALENGPLAPYELLDDRYRNAVDAPPQSLGDGSDDTASQTTSPSDYRPSTAVTSDLATTHDALQYELYADAIASFISDERTSAPLTIGIKAPWGAGKSSLMKMVRRKLDPDGATPSGDEHGNRLSNRDVLDKTKLPPERAANGFAIQPLTTRARRTTVWFNAWKYQSSEQFWAGLGHAIISQVEQRMTVAERERFWASLNIRRLDVREVRRRIYASFFERITGYLVASPFVVIALVFVAIWTPIAAAGGALVVAAAAAAGVFRRWKTFTKEDAAASNPQLVRDPGYEGRLGFLHFVHEDLERVLRLVASPERPLVVFVDDLDRCSYTTVANVIEALNAFLAGDFEHCIFVIAMEPDLVAAQIHVAYQALFDHLTARGDARGQDLGWRFLEKMVQLPLALPPPGDAQLKEFVGSLLNGNTQETMDLPDDDHRVAAARGEIEAARGNDTSLGGVEQALVTAKATHDQGDQDTGLSEAVLQRAARLVYADEFDDRAPEVRALVERHAADLERNPREIKRFLNVFRFYAYVAFWRRSADIDAPDLDGVAKLATLAVRCPQLLSALGDERLLATLEDAANSDELWANELNRAPEHVRTELTGAPQLRTIIGRAPRLEERAVGFL